MTWLAWIFPALLAFPQAEPEGSEHEKDPAQLDDIVVTATRTSKSAFHVPASVLRLTEEDIRERKSSRTLPEALKEEPGIMVQKTSNGQGSPYMRGFTGFRTLFLIDGIRLNNSVFRDGPNQYWNTVDPLSLSRLEVVKGPSSVLYGSDAVGGTVNAITRRRTEFEEGFHWDRTVSYRFASAERSHVGRAEISGNLDHDLGFVLGTSLKYFGEMRGGRSMGLQRKTDYEEWDGDFNVEYFLDPESSLTVAHQQVHLDDPWRSHKTRFAESFEGTTVGDEKKRILDQRRSLTYLQYRHEHPASFMEHFKASLSYQVQEEDRFRVRSDDRSDRQGFDVGTLGVFLQMESPSPAGIFTYGVEYYRDRVDSFSRKYNPDGSLNSIGIQGPVADDAAYDLFGLFLQDEIPLTGSTDLILGGRYTYARADADEVEDPATGNPFSLTDRWSTVVGSARLVFGLDREEHWNLFTGISQGFRAPNLSDLTRYDTARSNEIETPSPGLDPERFVSYEVGIKTRYDQVSAQAAYFYTDIRHMIVRTPTGNVIGGDAEVTKKNAGDGFVHGVEAGLQYRLSPRFTAFSNLTWIYGTVEGYPTSAAQKKEDVLDRLMPPTGLLGLRWDHESEDYWVEGLCSFADKADKLSERDTADTQRIPPGGTPGYAVFTLRSGWRIRKNMLLTAAVENLFNEDYRIHGSGQNEPGRNLVLGMSIKF